MTKLPKIKLIQIFKFWWNYSSWEHCWQRFKIYNCFANSK